MANPIGASIRVSRIKFSHKEQRLAKVTFELNFGEKRSEKLQKITIEVKPDYANVGSALILARKELAKCLSLMATQLEHDSVDDWA
ncbi:MAG: hypothetical protein OXI24_02335 [Candidatus Poribacteria bacterium]|nr:hypothetical protein [Candidatus Poribacteria bacterium]